MLRGMGQTDTSGAPGAFSSLTASGLFTLTGVEDGLTAHAGGTQAAALQLSAVCNYHRVSVCATAGDSIKLPAATVGQAHYLRNDGAASCQVFGAATETINAIASATGIALGVGMSAMVYCTTAGKWTGNFFGSAAFTASTAYVAAPTDTTFTAALTCGTSGTITLGTATLRAYKIGKQVTITGLLSTSAISSPVGTVTLGTFPYAAGAGNESRSSGTITMQGAAATATTSFNLIVAAGGTTATVFTRNAAGTQTSNAADISGATDMYVHLQYLTDS